MVRRMGAVRQPDVLCLHLVRLIAGGKRSDYVTFPELLDFTNLLPSVLDSCWQPTSAPYRLVAVIEHIGNASSGHFVTYRRAQMGWVRASDEAVRAVPFSEVQNCQAYMLFYVFSGGN